MARGNGRMAIFLDDVDYRQFAFLLGEVVHDYRLECWGFCGMPNHYHAILRPTRPNISAAIQKLNGEYAKWWNQRHARVGHTFQGRFRDQLVQQDEYLMTLIRYVARNPLRAGLVNDLAQWRFGSYRVFAGLDLPPPFLSVDAVLGQFGIGDVQTLRSRFTNFVLGDRYNAAIDDRLRSSDRVIGDRAFRTFVLGDSEDEPDGDDQATGADETVPSASTPDTSAPPA
jgi:REP element-mobilizing transposase RayT